MADILSVLDEKIEEVSEETKRCRRLVIKHYLLAQVSSDNDGDLLWGKDFTQEFVEDYRLHVRQLKALQELRRYYFQHQQQFQEEIERLLDV